MKRPILSDPTFDLNAPAKSLRMLVQPPLRGMHNAVLMPDQVLPYYPATSEIDENSLCQRMGQSLELFWNRQLNEMNNFRGFKSQHHLPLARVKKIMKTDPEVKMISSDTPPVFAKACEMFILELTLRAWMHTESCNRRTIQRYDIAEAIRCSEIYDFLIDSVPSGLHCVRHHGVDQNAVQEQVAPTAADQPVFPLPDMNVPISFNQIEQNLEVSPEMMADSFVTHEEFNLNSGFPWQ